MRSSRILLYGVLLFFPGSCNQVSSALQGPEALPDLQDIRQRGYLTALVDNNSYSYFIYRGQPMGFEYELLQNLAHYLQVDLRLQIGSGIEQGIEKLTNGEVDILAYPLTVTLDRTRLIKFIDPLFESRQVLVQRKPENWRSLTTDEINRMLIRRPVDLINKEVYVMRNSSFVQRLRNLSEETGGEIIIHEDSAGATSESLIKAVAEGKIDYTVTDDYLAQVNAAIYPNLDIETEISLPQQIAWAVRHTSPELLKAVNQWLSTIKKEPTFMVIYNRYFKSLRNLQLRIQSDYSSLGGNKISPYDELIKEGAARLNWDWRLLAALIYQESKFNPKNESWAGAAGLMQLMPETAQRFGAADPFDPAQNIRAGVKFLKHLDTYWQKEHVQEEDRIKFVLASYNAGLSHVIDARKLASVFGGNPSSWKDVEFYLLKKSDPKYYKHPVVMAGYCLCEEPVNYVKEILRIFEEYKLHISA
ncbi:MAG: transporter substrate-binding domain-containing protein [Cyclobacteriaceae bacterium]|nr:transporter substrate-binding domain-containing protein [Cyclobacteriaceae bacterium]